MLGTGVCSPATAALDAYATLAIDMLVVVVELVADRTCRGRCRSATSSMLNCYVMDSASPRVVSHGIRKGGVKSPGRPPT